MHSHSIDQWTHNHVFLGSRHHQHERRTWVVVGLTTVMMVGEIAVGWFSGWRCWPTVGTWRPTLPRLGSPP
jgi:Co/Zn/Cd efflux system component